MQFLSSSSVSSLNSKKIFCIPSNNQRWMSYFLVRSWGNYLFFPHPDVSQMYPFIKGKGGLYKVFDNALPFPFYNAEVFTIFGASTVGTSLAFHQDFQIEVFGEDYFDNDLIINQGCFRLTLDKQEYNFYDFDYPKDTFCSHEFSRYATIIHHGL